MRSPCPALGPLRLGLVALLAACSSPSRSSLPPQGAPGAQGPPAPRSERSRPPAGLAELGIDGPGDYLRPASSGAGDDGVLHVEGRSGVVIDLDRVRLRGTRPRTDLDRSAGLGIVIDGCQDVTVRGGELGGYKGCLVVRNSRGVVIEGVSFDGWYAQRLLSTVTTENEADWLWPHENDAGEWLANYGAAISVTDSEDVTIRDCEGRHGQNGILLTRTRHAEVYDNDFSFLSGWGLALYRSSSNVVSRNRFDYCVRGYSHGQYWRGQDSAGILLFERSSDNVVAFNSATHSGDGIFVYGGQDVVLGRARERGETVVGGCDRNLFWGNDLSFAVANSLEATFSRQNIAVRNKLSGSHQHGVWGGYSSDFVIADNEIENTQGGGITIEHGQDCLISKNRLRGNEIGIELYWDEDPDLVGGPFGQYENTSSSGHWIVENEFRDNDQDVVLKRSSAITFSANRFPRYNRRLYLDRIEAEGEPEVSREDLAVWMEGAGGTRPSGHVSDTTLRRDSGQRHARAQLVDELAAPDVPGDQVTNLTQRGLRRGLETIVMGEWGPWDYASGEPKPPQRRAGGVLAETRWRATWFAWKAGAQDPRGDLDAWRALRFEPLVREEVGNWLDPWAQREDVRVAVGEDHFGLVAETDVVVADSGRYRLTVVSDDGVRVAVDGRVVLQDWTWHAARTETVELHLDAGPHAIELEYFQIEGAAALRIELEPLDV